MIRIIENQAGNDQIQMLTAETQMAKALWEFFFFFQNSRIREIIWH